MFKALILQASHNLSDERTEYLIHDRLSFMRFLGLGLADTVPDANTIWTFREALTRALITGKPAVEVLFERFNAALAAAGFLAMSGQIIDASIRGCAESSATPTARNETSKKGDYQEFRAEVGHDRLEGACPCRDAKNLVFLTPCSTSCWPAPIPRRLSTLTG
jgi:hypothetical protein